MLAPRRTLLKTATRWRLARSRVAILFGVVVTALLIVLVTVASERSYQIAAATWGGELNFRGHVNDWNVERATLCRARTNPDLRAGDMAGPCPASRFHPPEALSDDVIRWAEGTRVHFRRMRDGQLILRTLNDGTERLPVDSLLVIPAEVWAGHGALTFTAEVRIGGDMGPGARDYLIGGTWEARQTGLATSVLRDVTEVVKQGHLSRGASVRVVKEDGDDPVVSYGHVSPAAKDDPGVEIVALSERGRLTLEAQYFGLTGPSRFTPDWIDTISSSPMLVALPILLTFILTVVELIAAVLSFGRNREGDSG